MIDRIKELLTAALPEIQALYEEWTGDGDDPEFGSGGICDAVAEIMADTLAGHFDVTGGGQDGDDHAWLYVGKAGMVWEVDLPHNMYESGGGYNWRKIRGVTFAPDDFVIVAVPVDAGHYDQMFNPDPRDSV